MTTINIDLRGLNPAPVTPFTRDGAVDYAACKRLGAWLGSIEGVKSLTVLGHAGEGTFLTQYEQARVIEAFVESVNGAIPVIAGITLEGTQVAAEEAKRAEEAAAQAAAAEAQAAEESAEAPAEAAPETVSEETDPQITAIARMRMAGMLQAIQAPSEITPEP